MLVTLSETITIGNPLNVPIRILVADDYADWRVLIRSVVQQRSDIQVICEVGDGLEALAKTEELKPDLVLLDIGLPGLNGIEVARQLILLSPNSRAIFVSSNNSPDIVQAALNTAALGYVYKPHIYRDLLPAIESALAGKAFVSSGVWQVPD
jgi:DNA-binding NarL/FixJ family response regulator